MKPAPSACPTCGASYKRNDFGTDGSGNCIVIHICDRRAKERAAQPVPQSQWRQPRKYTCPVCHRFYMAVQERKRCPPCTTKLKRLRALEFYYRRSA